MRLDRRPAGEADRTVARGIHHRAFREVVEHQFGSWEESLQDRFFDSEWDRQAHELLVVDGEPAGYLAVEHLDDHTFIHNIVLDPPVQGRGLGAALLADIIETATARSCSVRLQVLHANRAVELYRRLGFVETGRTSTHLVMERAPTDGRDIG